MNTTSQWVGAWAGIGFTVLFCLGFLVAGFIPPPDPKLPADQVAQLYIDNHPRIRIGLLTATLASALLALWVATIGVQMRRLEGQHSVLAFAQMLSGACLILESLFPLLAWQTAAYRTDRDPAMIQALNDLGWLPFLGIACTALMFIPASCVVLFQDGPLAWNGLISWWLALVTYFTWMVGLTWMLLRAITQQEQQERTAGEGGPVVHELAPDTVARLEREIAELRAAVGQRA